jgi:hypothetical protein
MTPVQTRNPKKTAKQKKKTTFYLKASDKKPKPKDKLLHKDKRKTIKHGASWTT